MLLVEEGEHGKVFVIREKHAMLLAGPFQDDPIRTPRPLLAHRAHVAAFVPQLRDDPLFEALVGQEANQLFCLSSRISSVPSAARA